MSGIISEYYDDDAEWLYWLDTLEIILDAFNVTMGQWIWTAEECDKVREKNGISKTVFCQILQGLYEARVECELHSSEEAHNVMEDKQNEENTSNQ